MDNALIYQTLKMQFGALAKAAKDADVTTQTVRNILLNNIVSEKTGIVLSTAKKIAVEILDAKKLEADKKISELQTAIAQYDELRNRIAA